MMSLNTLLLMGVRTLGDFPAGAVMAFIGAPATAVGSAAVVAITVGIVFAKRIRMMSRRTINPDLRL
jgi:hypothetical protein